jgi:AcrR family transcriptional regulator
MKPEDRKNAIVKAAVECFAGLGYHATSISHIIESAGIARGTFYLYFKSKHEIFQFILDDFIAHLAMQIKTIDLAAAESPAVQMRGNVERVVDAILSRPELSKILFNEAVGLDETTQGRLKAFYGQLLTIIQSSIRRGMAAGLIRKVDPELAACIALGGIREIITQGHVFGNVEIKREALIEGLIDVLFGGIGPRLIAS